MLRSIIGGVCRKYGIFFCRNEKFGNFLQSSIIIWINIPERVENDKKLTIYLKKWKESNTIIIAKFVNFFIDGGQKNE